MAFGYEKEVERQRDEALAEVARLKEAIRRLAEREAVELAYSRLTADPYWSALAATLRGLLERLGGK